MSVRVRIVTHIERSMRTRVLASSCIAALLAIVSAIGAWELFRIARAGGLTPFDDVGIALAGIVPLVVHARYLGLYDPGKTLSPLSLAALVVLFLLAGRIERVSLKRLRVATVL